jgi:hypothetical protein
MENKKGFQKGNTLGRENKGKPHKLQQGFQKGNTLFEHPKAMASRFKKGQVSTMKGKPAPWAKNLPQKFKSGHKSWTEGKKIWKGNSSDYQKIHYWVKIKKGKRRRCNNCGKKNNKSKNSLVWANISQKYLWDLNDWECLCRSCHTKNDMNFIKQKYGTK